jgi:inosine-uridine nucleoside N-ribohydrolase
MLDILSSNPPDTVDIIALGPLTTVALAAAIDPQCLLRARSLVYMGGAISKPGNITPLAEFNIFADPIAAARVFALSSPLPPSTMPPQSSALQPYPSTTELGDRRLKIILFPLDITEQHPIPLKKYTEFTDPLVAAGSPLATFGAYLFKTTFAKLESLNHDIQGFTLHDPLCCWYVMDAEKQPGAWSLSEVQDIRVETAGQWSRGACIIDRRGRKDMAESDVLGEEEVSGDTGGWLSRKRGNKVQVCESTPGCEAFADLLLESVYKGT